MTRAFSHPLSISNMVRALLSSVTNVVAHPPRKTANIACTLLVAPAITIDSCLF